MIGEERDKVEDCAKTSVEGAKSLGATIAVAPLDVSPLDLSPFDVSSTFFFVPKGRLQLQPRQDRDSFFSPYAFMPE